MWPSCAMARRLVPARRRPLTSRIGKTGPLKASHGRSTSGAFPPRSIARPTSSRPATSSCAPVCSWTPASIRPSCRRFSRSPRAARLVPQFPLRSDRRLIRSARPRIGLPRPLQCGPMPRFPSSAPCERCRSTGYPARWLGLLLAGCSFSSSSQSAPADATLIYAQPEDPKTLDPINTDIAEAVHVLTNVFDTLVTYHDETTEIVPALAESWEHTADGLTWTFHLRDRASRSTTARRSPAEAVKVSLERLIASRPSADVRQGPAVSVGLQHDRPRRNAGRAHGRAQAQHPSAILLANLAMFPASIVSPAALKKHGPATAEHPVGTGPFRFVKWSRDQQLVTAAFDQHWRGRPEDRPPDLGPGQGKRHARAAAGPRRDPPGREPDAGRARRAGQESASWPCRKQLGMNVAYLTMQIEKPPLDNLAVRQAIYMAIDKRRLVKVGYAGHAQPAVSMVPPAMWGIDDQFDDAPVRSGRAPRRLLEASRKGSGLFAAAQAVAVGDEPGPALPAAARGDSGLPERRPRPRSASK